jgi:hypothetical protein
MKVKIGAYYKYKDTNYVYRPIKETWYAWTCEEYDLQGKITLNRDGTVRYTYVDKATLLYRSERVKPKLLKTLEKQSW